ncbi:MAG TPA: hypothetical protein VIA29_03855, partial [Thermoanaerobaculia bacterium]
MKPIRLPRRAARVPLLLLLAVFSSFSAIAQAPPPPMGETSALPPPVTRSQYRTNWFVFLNALLEDDSKTADQEGRRAEAAGLRERASRAFEAALKLDEDNADARAARAWFLFR